MGRMSNPLLIALLNIAAGILVAHGIIDDTFKDQLITLMDNAIAALMTLGIAVYTIYKSYEAHKHHMTITSTKQVSSTTGTDITSNSTTTAEIPTNPPAPVEEQTGLPL